MSGGRCDYFGWKTFSFYGIASIIQIFFQVVYTFAIKEKLNWCFLFWRLALKHLKLFLKNKNIYEFFAENLSRAPQSSYIKLEKTNSYIYHIQDAVLSSCLVQVLIFSIATPQWRRNFASVSIMVAFLFLVFLLPFASTFIFALMGVLCLTQVRKDNRPFKCKFILVSYAGKYFAI